MTALAKQHIDTVAIDWNQWIEANDAAQRLGKHPGHYRRNDCPRLAEQGLAMFVKPAAGGNPRWFVSRRINALLLAANDYLAGLHRAPAEEIASLSERQRQTMYQRWECVLALRQLRRTANGRIADHVPALVLQLRQRFSQLQISRGSLYRWDSTVKTEADIIKLADRRGGDQKSQGDKAAWDFFESIFLDQRKPSIKSCWKRTKEWASQNSVAWCNEKSCQRQLEKRIPPAKQAYHRDPELYRSKFAPFLEQHAERFAANECWMADHRPFDLLCRISDRIFRPYVTCVHDWRTRKIVGWAMSESPNSSTILAAFSMALRDPSNHGGPALAWFDNGKDFKCYSFHGISKQMRRKVERVQVEEASTRGLFGRLNIEMHFANPHGPQGKARCEAVFNVVRQHFDVTFETYTSNSPETKPEQLADIIKKKAHLVPTFEHVRDRFAKWVIGHNATLDHTIEDLVDADGVKLSRGAAFEAWAQRRLGHDPADLDMLLQHHHMPVRVGRNGISLKIAGRRVRYGQFEPALDRLKGTDQEVLATYDPENLESVRVYLWPSLSYLCDAPRNGNTGIHNSPAREEHLRRLTRKKAEHRRALKAVNKNPHVQYSSDEELIALEVAEDVLSNTNTDPYKITPPPAAPNKPASEKPRKAAGADGVALPQVRRGLPDVTRLQNHDASPTFGGADLPSPSRLVQDDTLDVNGVTSDPWARFQGD